MVLSVFQTEMHHEWMYYVSQYIKKNKKCNAAYVD